MPCQLQKDAIRKVENLYDEFRVLYKSNKEDKESKGEILTFISKLPDLFNI